MEYQYFQCDWIIRDNISLRDLTVISNRLNLNMRFNPFQENEQGFSIVPIRIKVDNESSIQELVEMFGEKTGLTVWRPVSAQVYPEGFTLSTLRDMKYEEARLAGKWLESFYDRGRKNAELLKKTDGKSG
jgi:hypothetical protein